MTEICGNGIDENCDLIDSVCPVPGCTTSSLTWQNTPLPSQTGLFTVTFNSTPNNANMNGVTGLSLGSASDYTYLATIVRFNETGFIDARNGNAYRANGLIP